MDIPYIIYESRYISPNFKSRLFLPNMADGMRIFVQEKSE